VTDLTSRTSARGIAESRQTGRRQVNVSYYEGFRVVTDPVTGRSRNVSQLRSEGPEVDRITGFSIHSSSAANGGATCTPASQRGSGAKFNRI
jgi:hypothetical protein